ncbi:hypothetical protein GTQ99_00400 [Kineococcus sp. T13]|uniref:hypothetical protein n=1 Tax=Kineococcus vitellinus TaxID=2696565 RepID=UPI001411F124|nr:hypothetical protein [Kineococcus vitellinus]NAZ73891.1 hypothetical protein [Kineococcus vitellinus]
MTTRPLGVVQPLSEEQTNALKAKALEDILVAARIAKDSSRGTGVPARVTVAQIEASTSKYGLWENT